MFPVPLGQYDSTRLVILGTNRWTFRSEIDVSKAIESLTLELAQNVNFFTTNRNFFGGNQLDRDPSTLPEQISFIILGAASQPSCRLFTLQEVVPRSTDYDRTISSKLRGSVER